MKRLSMQSETVSFYGRHRAVSNVMAICVTIEDGDKLIVLVSFVLAIV